MVFDEVSEVVEVTEGATNQALFRSEDLLQSLHNGTLHSEVGVEGTGDTHRVVGTIGTMKRMAFMGHKMTSLIKLSAMRRAMSRAWIILLQTAA